MANIPKFVHLDLKGAAPHVSYLQKIIPLISKWGATGLLIEYEDMFPYQRELSEIKRSSAYSITQVKEILSLAHQNNLSVIPLVQTFGHFEFVLKHDKFRRFREMDLYPNALCPEHPNATELVLSLIKQIIDLHPYSKQIHIGADEVWHLGKCDRCIKKMQIHNWKTIDLFLNWVSKIASLVKINFPAIDIIIWDDMIRTCSSQTLEAFEIGFLVEPMIWKYDAENFDFPIDMFDNYAKVFNHVWVASCFKGATGSSQSIVPIQHHINNHLTWLTTLKYMTKFKEIKGIALTGWQSQYRLQQLKMAETPTGSKNPEEFSGFTAEKGYDHYAVLCEMLPVAIPCLALCLCVLKHGSFLEGDHDKISQELGFCNKINVHPFPRPQIMEQGMTFPGHELYGAAQIWSNVVCRYQVLSNSEGMLGWFNEYLRLKNFTNPAQVENILFPLVELYDNMVDLQKKFEKHLSETFYEDTVEEWLGCFVYPIIKKVDNIIKDCKEQISLATTHADMELQSPVHF